MGRGRVCPHLVSRSINGPICRFHCGQLLIDHSFSLRSILPAEHYWQDAASTLTLLPSAEAAAHGTNGSRKMGEPSAVKKSV